MTQHIVREIKKYHHTAVANCMGEMGYCWPRRRPHNVEKMLIGVPRVSLEKLLAKLDRAAAASGYMRRFY